LLPAGQRASGEWIDDTLRARAEEKGLLARTPLAGEFPRQRVELIRGADPTAEVNRLFRLRGWTTGCPSCRPPSASRRDDRRRRADAMPSWARWSSSAAGQHRKIVAIARWRAAS
jgi:hypothetical protein